MHLTQAIKTGKNNKNFHLLDFLCFKSAKIKNQVLYHTLQPYHYYNALKNNQPTYPHQRQLIQEINQMIGQYNQELAQRQNSQKKLDEFNKNKGLQNNIENPDENSLSLENTQLKNSSNYKQEPKEKILKKSLKFIDENHYWLDNIDLLQYISKHFDNYSLLHSQTSQQVIHQVVQEFKSFRELVKSYTQKKIKYFPQVPYYLDKLLDRNIVHFSNQQVRIQGKYFIISWQGSDFSKEYKRGNYDHVHEVEIDNRVLKSILTNNPKQEAIDKSYAKINEENKKYNKPEIKNNFIIPNHIPVYKLKDNKHLTQEIIHKEAINELTKETEYKTCLRTTYHKFPDKLRIRIPQPIFDLGLTQDNLRKFIKDIRIIPDFKQLPDSYTIEIITQHDEFKLKNLSDNLNKKVDGLTDKNNDIEINNQKPSKNIIKDKSLTKKVVEKPLIRLLKNTLSDDKKLNQKFIAGSYKLTHDFLKKIKAHVNNQVNHCENINSVDNENNQQSHSQINFENLMKDLNVCSLDPGLKRLFTLTSNQGLQPLIFNDNSLIACNQYFNKKIAQEKSRLEIHWNQQTSQKLRNLHRKRNNSIKNYLHQISSFIVKYLVENNVDLLVIGKNKGQKQEINIGARNNQAFVQIPFSQLWNQIAYKAYQQGILVIEQEESYTSKSSFIHEDSLPEYSPYKLNLEKFTGRRYQGQYQLRNKINKPNIKFKDNHQNLKINNNLIKNIIFHHELYFIHADINGSYNILRKFYQSIGIRFNLETLIKNIKSINSQSHLKSSLTNPTNIKNNLTISRKLQHRLFQPYMVDLSFIETYHQGLNLSKNKLKVLEEVRNKDKTSHGIVSLVSDEIQSELLGISIGLLKQSYKIKDKSCSNV